MEKLYNCILTTDYTWDIMLIHWVSAFLLFFIVNWFGKQSVSIGYKQISISEEDSEPAFNLIFRVISPVVFFVLFIVLFQSINLNDYTKNAYMIVVYYWIIRTMARGLWGRFLLINKVAYLFCIVLSIGITYWLYSATSKVENILPDPHSLLDEMWILIIMFIYNVFNRLHPSEKKAMVRREKYITNKYHEFKKKYNSIIESKCHNEFYESVIYAIMICEDFNRPKFVRLIERIHFYLTRRPHTLGIMQVRTEKLIDDKTSILMAADIIKNATLMHKNRMRKDTSEYKYDSPRYAVYNIAGEYNCYNEQYQCEVGNIYDIVEGMYNNVEEEYNKILL